MAWSTTDIATNDIIKQDGVFAYNFEASGTIYKGQFVAVTDDNKVGVTTASAPACNAIGVACYNATDGEQISIACGGNIVICCADASIQAGTAVYGDTDGTCDSAAGNATKVAGYVVDDTPSDVSGSVSATYHVVKVLLV